MAETKLAPLSIQVPIVDPTTGNPTPYFQQLMQIFIDEKNDVSDDLTENIEDLEDLTVVVSDLEDDINDLEDVVNDLELDDLTDVDTTTTPPTDGQALVWVDADSQWAPGDVASGGGGSFKGCFLYKSTTQSITAGVVTALTWDLEKFDTDGYHSTSSNTDRITVVTSGYVELSASVFFASATGQAGIYISHFNSAGTEQHRWAQDTDNTGGDTNSVTTGPVAVTAGDFFRCYAYVDTTRNVNGGTGANDVSSFSMQVLGAPGSLGSGAISQVVVAYGANATTTSSTDNIYLPKDGSTTHQTSASHADNLKVSFTVATTSTVLVSLFVRVGRSGGGQDRMAIQDTSGNTIFPIVTSPIQRIYGISVGENNIHQVAFQGRVSVAAGTHDWVVKAEHANSVVSRNYTDRMLKVEVLA